MKKHTRTAAFALALCICAVSAAGCGDKKTSDNSSYDKAEKTTTAAVTEEAATEAAPTTEEITTEAAAEAGFRTIEGLSDRYADTQTIGFSYNGQVFRLGEATVQQLVDAGIEFDPKDLERSYSNGDEIEAKIQMGGSAKLTIQCKPFGTYSAASTECVLSSLDLSGIDNVKVSDTGVEIGTPDAMKDENSGVKFNFPLDLTKEELVANSGEPAYIKSTSTYVYEGPSLFRPDNDKYTARCRFVFDNGVFFRYHANADIRKD